MNTSDQKINDPSSTSHVFDTVIRIGLAFLLFAWVFQILTPFIIPVMWGIVIAVAIHPLYLKLCSLLGGRHKIAAALYTLIALALLISPAVMISGSLVDTSQQIATKIQQGTLVIPPPDQSVSEWPLVGEKVHAIWSQAASNLEETLKKYSPELKKAAKVIISFAAGAGGGVLMFILSIIISGILLASSSGAYHVSLKIFTRLTGDKQGQHFTDLAAATIRSVAQGVLGVALIQTVLAAIGMYFMDVPGWGLWSIFILVLAVAQLPPLLILGPVVVYVFSVADTTPAVIFTVWSLLVSMSDGFLKPIFLGRGMETPMLVILLGAIGGMLMSGILGLFVGAIVLALGYELFMAWLNQNQESVSEES